MNQQLHPLSNVDPVELKTTIKVLGKILHFLQSEEMRQSSIPTDQFPPIACEQYLFWHGTAEAFETLYHETAITREIFLCEDRKDLFRIFSPWDGGHPIRLGKKKLSEVLYLLEAFAKHDIRLVQRTGSYQTIIPIVMETGDGPFKDRIITSSLSRSEGLIIGSESTRLILDRIIQKVISTNTRTSTTRSSVIHL